MTRRILVATAAALALATTTASGCANDASLHITWTINGQPANGDRCAAVGASWVRILEDNDNDGTVEEYSRDMPCSNGAGETVRRYVSGETTWVAFELLALGGIVIDRVPETSFQAFTPTTGTNEIPVAFTVP